VLELFCIASLCLISPTLSVVSGQVTTAPAAATDNWNGTVTLPDGGKLEFSVSLSGASGKIDIPMQGATGLALSDVTNDGKALKFTLKVGTGEATWARFDAAVDEGGQTASGQLHQAGMDLPLKLTKAKEGEEAPKLKRPQEPKPPFRYHEREVAYTNEADGTKLAGTLTIPPGDGKFPAVLLITGSGAQDRNETLLGHKPFLVLADHLSRHGIAVLRVDDRGVGGSSGSVSKSTTADFVGDVLTGVHFLSQQPEIDAKKIGLIGHSEGGIIAPMAAARSNDVAFIVLMAGTGLPGRDIIKLQGELISRAEGASDVEAKATTTSQDEIFDLVVGGADEAAIRAKIRDVGEKQIAAHEKSDDPADQEKVKIARKNMDATVEQQTQELTSPWFKYFLTLDPREALRKTHCPVLAINGAKDLQVPPIANLPEIEKALKEADNKDVTIKELANLNHLFQKCKTGSPSEYASIEETINPAALELITVWVRQHVHLAPEQPAVN
jgi:pimeloyl-ACP methyl ester carboxylesterase